MLKKGNKGDRGLTDKTDHMDKAAKPGMRIVCSEQCRNWPIWNTEYQLAGETTMRFAR